MKHRLLASLVLISSAAVAAYSGTAGAQADPRNSAYVLYGQGTPDNNVVRSGTGLCWRTGYWTPAMAIAACDPDLVAGAPAAAKAAAVTPPPPPPAASVTKVTLSSKALFDFNKAVLKPEGKRALDTEVIGKLKTINKLELVLVTGHADRIGSQAYNQKLSERRANAVRDYLVANGVPKAKIETLGMGKTQPLPGVKCEMTNRKELIACLAPNRRVEVEAKGEAAK
jgi:OOP family OmpA-OmpF porin